MSDGSDHLPVIAPSRRQPAAEDQMSGKRWTRWLTAPLALVAIGVLVSRFQPGAEAGGRAAPPMASACTGSSPLGSAGVIGSAYDPSAQRVWWRLTDAMDANGILTGRTLFAGRGARTTLTMSLGTESMARGPVAGLVIVATDDGRTSEVRVVDIAAGCSWLVHRDRNVVRSAILDAGGHVGYAHLVDRDSRSDLGVFRIAGDDADAQLERVVEPLPLQPDLGPVWATELRLDADSTSLAVQSCSDRGCLTRIAALDGTDSAVTTLRGEGQGSIIGFSGERVVTWAFCSGMPCDVQAWIAAKKEPAVLARQAIGAGLTGDGRYLLVVTNASGRAVRVDLVANETSVVTGVNSGELPLSAAVTATAGIGLAPDEVGLASTGSDARALAPGIARTP